MEKQTDEANVTVKGTVALPVQHTFPLAATDHYNSEHYIS